MTKTDTSTRKKNLRKKFINLRNSLQPSAKLEADTKISNALETLLNDCKGPVSFYWPMRNEFDPVTIISKWLISTKGRYAALPIIIQKNSPMKFLNWDTKTKLENGLFNLLAPPKTSPEVKPSVIIIPCVGFDSKNYRIGYGGGYYDRTLVQYPDAKKIGIGYKSCRIENLWPEKYDIPMDLVICS